MDISRKMDYALRMLAELVKSASGIISVKTAADANDIPYSFARSIQHELVHNGLVESLRGSRGGMRLAVDPSDITLLQIMEAVQGPLVLTSCTTSGPDGGPCLRMEQCPYNPIWNGAQKLLSSYFSSITLAEVVAGTAAPVVDVSFTKPHTVLSEKVVAGSVQRVGEKGPRVVQAPTAVDSRNEASAQGAAQ